jgi:hypothetical protein
MEYEAKLSDIIASLPEVAGGFLYAPDKGIYSNQTAGIANDGSLQQVSMKLTKIVSMISVHFHDTGGIRVCFKDLILFGTVIEDGHWLFLLHQPSLSLGMIKMTVQMALNIEPDVTPQSQLSEVSQDVTDSNINTSATEDIMEILLAPESELREPLTGIQKQLALHIGPVAELVFQDSVEIWAGNATPSLENLPELISMMEEEIDDDDDRKTFRDNLKSTEEE